MSDPEPEPDLDADYVIVGAGSAGCVLADRLSEDGSRVLLLEAGPADRNPLIHIPAGIGHLVRHRRLNWNFATEPEPGLADRSLHWPRGRVLGGSSSINGMLYVRGNPADYDMWAQMGCRGWGFADVLPFFRMSERYRPGDPALRGQAGPMRVEDYRTILPVTHDFVRAARQAGHAFNPDVNGSTQDGVGYSQMTRNGRFRGSTATTFLARARRRPNLRIVTGALATRLVFDGRRCTGVRFRRRAAECQVRAAREVILAAGAIGSPHLLQVSGVGPAAHLAAIGIAVRHDLPGVGLNLIDHYAAQVTHRLRGTVSINEMSRGWHLAREVLRFVLAGNGALTFGVTAAMLFCRSHADLASPDLQLLFTPSSFDRNRFGVLEREPGATVSVCVARPQSRGSILARSPDPAMPPAIRPNYLSAPADLRALLAGMRACRRVLAQPAFAARSAGELWPGPTVAQDTAVAEYARATGGSVFHPVGTCRMGTDDAAVVDPRLRLRGLGGLRVVDASIMPTITTGNTNAPTIMIAEKAAAMIREEARA